MRLIVDRKIRGKGYEKADLSRRFGLSSRLYNSADVVARGEYASLEKTKVLALHRAKAKYDKALWNYARGHCKGMSEEEGQRLIARMGKWRRRVERQEANLPKPRYFPGHDAFEQQHLLSRDEFKKRYQEAPGTTGSLR